MQQTRTERSTQPDPDSGAPLETSSADLQDARQTQQKLYPDAPAVDGFDIGGATFPLQATGGDCFDYIPLRDDHVAIVIGDVSGHGLGASLLMASTRAYVRAFAQMNSNIGWILAAVNRVLVDDVEPGRFVTLFLARLEPQTRSLVYTSAGHSMGYLLDASGRLKRQLECTGCPLGIDVEGTFPVAPPLALEAGETVVLLTDGILEACGPGGATFGIDCVLETLRRARHRTAREMVDALYQAVVHFCKDQPQRDDLTAVIIKALG